MRANKPKTAIESSTSFFSWHHMVFSTCVLHTRLLLSKHWKTLIFSLGVNLSASSRVWVDCILEVHTNCRNGMLYVLTCAQVLFDHNGCLKKYNTVMEVLHEFYEVRFALMDNSTNQPCFS